MKRLLLLTALLCLGGSATAQSWTEILKKIATAAADKLTDGQLTRRAIVGTWNYTGPGVKLEGGDWTSELSGAAVESTVAGKLESIYRLAGIEPGASSFTFGDDETFEARFGSRTLSGTYEFDSSTHEIALHFTKGDHDLGTIKGHAYLSGSELQLVFPITKLVSIMTTLSSTISSLENISKLLSRYENVYIGFQFDK